MENKRNKAKIITEAVSGLIFILSVVVYLIIGFVTDKWHPWWLVIICGIVLAAIVDILVNMIAELKQADKTNNTDENKE